MAELPLYDKFREKELANLLEKLGEKLYSGKEIISYANRFAELYNVKVGYLRIPYGVISGNITTLYNKHGKDYLDQIVLNLNSIMDALLDLKDQKEPLPFEQKHYVQAYKSVMDLQDYVSMEVIRADQIARQFEEAKKLSSEAIKKAQELSQNAKNLLDDTQELRDGIAKIENNAGTTLEKATKISEEAKDLKTDVVSILAIFAAIVIAFSGGLAILGQAIAAIATPGVSIYRLLMVVLFCVWGLFNTVYLLLCVVARLCGKNLSMGCKNSDCGDCAEKEKCKGLCRFSKRAPYVVGFNIFLIVAASGIIIFKFWRSLELTTAVLRGILSRGSSV